MAKSIWRLKYRRLRRHERYRDDERNWLAFADSFDRTQWVVIDRRNAAVIDLTEASPTVGLATAGTSGRELPLDTPNADRRRALVMVDRDTTRTSDNELRTWTPSMSRLTNRTPVTLAEDVSTFQLIPDGYVAQPGPTSNFLAGNVARLALGTDDEAWTAGNLLRRPRIHRTTGGFALRACPNEANRSSTTSHRSGPEPRVRSHGVLVTVWDFQSRIHAIDLDENRTGYCSVRVTL